VKVFSEVMLLPKYLRLDYIFGKKKKGKIQPPVLSPKSVCWCLFSQNFHSSFYRYV